jgi:hypothetical protein
MRKTRLGSGGYGIRLGSPFADKGSGAHDVDTLTRLGSGGYGVRRAGSFAGKGASGRNIDKTTRLGTGGYGVRRAGSFAGKSSGSTHPVALITRLGSGGYGVRRAGSFAGKTPSTEVEEIFYTGGTSRRFSIRPRNRDDEDIPALTITILQLVTTK